MRIVCCECKVLIRETPTGEGDSHGLCPSCFDAAMAKLAKLSTQPSYKKKGPSVSVRVNNLTAASISGGGNIAPCDLREDAAIGDGIDRYRLSRRQAKEVA